MIKEFKYQKETIRTYIPKQSYKKSYVLRKGFKTVSNFEIIEKVVKRFIKQKINYSVDFESVFLILSGLNKSYKIQIKEVL